VDLILEGILRAVRLLVSLDPEVLRITALSLQVSGIATLISLLINPPGLDPILVDRLTAPLPPYAFHVVSTFPDQGQDPDRNVSSSSRTALCRMVFSGSRASR